MSSFPFFLIINGLQSFTVLYRVAGDKVEFSIALTNEEFKQKLVEIYPSLENACFMFMKAGKDNTLKDLNPGICCYRCYTPENVYSSDRGQGKLYIRMISENEVLLTCKIY